METPGTTLRSGSSAILEDPTGQRARWMRWAGRLVFVLFLGWLLAIVAGGLGLLPVSGLPLTHVLRPSREPPPLSRLPRPKPPSASDLRPAIPAAAFSDRAAKATLFAHRVRAHGHSSSAPGRSNGLPRGRSTTTPRHVKAIPSTTPPEGRSGNAPHGLNGTARGQTETARSTSLPRRTSAPGQTKTTTSATPLRRSTSAPGQTKTTTSATPPQRRSTSAPGQTTMPSQPPRKP